MPQERPNAFDFWGPQTLIGPELKPGDPAPSFRLSQGKESLSSAQFAGKPLIISVVPSIDTGTVATDGVLATGSGEPPTAPMAAAIANAFFDATGVRIREAPMTPARVRNVLRAGGSGVFGAA